MSGRSGKCLGAPSFATGFAPHRSRCIPSSAEREDETLRRLALGGFTAAVVAGGGDGVGVASQLLHGEDVGPGLEQGGDKGPAQVVRGEGGRSSLLLAPTQDERHRLAAYAADRDLAVLADRAEQWPGLFTSRLQPALDQADAFGGEVYSALLPPLAVADQD